MIDRFTDGLLTPTETSSYLQIPQSTLDSWLRGEMEPEQVDALCRAVVRFAA
ncbi:hypothetical protein [Streptomyces chryseus]|uniref:hypothetical protein n=1 Tax=Streptomyces chryseus TaxID=68186 RepID=UPI001E56BD91|nr:hypothetical protein [Streptomyces chryseus]